MNIIIEGPDATGKSTLAIKVLNKYKMTSIIHSTSSTRNDYTYHADLLDAHECAVFDRFHIGEMIFPEIYKREGKLTFEEFSALNKKIIDNHDMLIILYTSDLKVLEDRLIERGEYNYLDEIKEQNELFAKYAYILDVYEYNLFKFVDISKPGAYDELDEWIDSHYNKKTINVAYRQICRDLMERGHVMETKNLRGNTLELCNYMFTIDDLNDDCVTLITGKSNLTYLAAELLWYNSARNDLDFIGKFSQVWAKVSDDGKTSNSAYGYILQKKHGFDQIGKIIELLKYDPYSRRAVLNINVPNENVITTKDEPCTVCIDFQIRDGKLHCTVVMRSNDVYFGLRNDLSYFIYLQKYVASQLNVPVGTYTHFAMSMHVYDRDFNIIKNVAYGTLDSDKYVLDVNALIKNQDKLIAWVDDEFTNKDDFETMLIDLGVIHV